VSAARGPSFDRRHAVIEPAHAGTGAGAGKAATFVVATAIGCIAAVAIVHWIELEGLTGAGAAAAMLPAAIGVPSRRTWLHRLALRARLAWARYNLRTLQVDIDCMEADLIGLPAHIAFLRRHAAARQARVERLEGALR
jgi:hypothetical protein